MIFIRLLRFLTGYIIFTAKGGFPERFLNLCANSNIPLWDVVGTPEGLRASTSIKGYKSIRRPAHKSGMRARIESKCGLPFITHRHRRRVGLLAGAGAALIILTILSSLLWNIDISGNERVKTDIILESLETLGVKKAAIKSKIDTRTVEQALLDSFPDLSWVALHIHGSRATLEVRERVTPPEMFDSSSPCNLIASRDGEILKIEAASGNIVVEAGSAVRKGDLLVSGVLESKFHLQYVHARGSALARTSRALQSTAQKQFTSQYVSAERLRYSLYIFGLRIPLGLPAKTYDEHTTNESYLVASGTELPLGLVCERYTSFGIGQASLSEARATLVALADYYSQYKQNLSEAEVLSSDVRISQTSAAAVVRGTYKAQEDIAREQPFEVESQP